jgi:predicted nucleic acid-binding protein
VIVADATLVSGLLFPEDDFHKLALAVRDKDADWRCPELVFSEVRSLGFKRRGKGIPLDTIIAQCNLTAGAVAVHRLHAFSVLSVAEEGGIWTYDAEYVALARQLSVRLVTSDEELVKKFPPRWQYWRTILFEHAKDEGKAAGGRRNIEHRTLKLETAFGTTKYTKDGSV